jgi:hypothetical protein
MPARKAFDAPRAGMYWGTFFSSPGFYTSRFRGLQSAISDLEKFPALASLLGRGQYIRQNRPGLPTRLVDARRA